MTRRELMTAALGGFLARPVRRIILIELSGGPSHVDTFDLRVGPWTPSWMAPIRFGEILFPSGLMPNLARMLDRITLVRGLQASAMEHRPMEPGWPFLRASATSFEAACDHARWMIRGGTQRVHIRLGSWDHHGNLYDQLRMIAGPFDAGVASLVAGLDRDGAFESTQIVAMGEFGRRPGPLNQNAGRDHYPAHAALLAGGGIRGGGAIG
jgi:hypothetical protein